MFGLIRFLRQLRPAGRFFELGRDGGPGCPVRVSRRRAQLVIVHLLIRQGLQIGQFAPCPHGAALHRAPLVKVDDLHRCIFGRLREGAEVNGPLGGIVAVILRWLLAPGALLHLKQLFVIINALGEVLFRYLAVAVIMAPIIVPLAVLRFGKLPCDKGTGGRLVIAQGKPTQVFDDRSIEENEANFFAAELLLEDGEVLECLSEHTFFETAKMLYVPAALLDYKFSLLHEKGELVNSMYIRKADFLKGDLHAYDNDIGYGDI